MGCLVAALAGAGRSEVFDDESVGHCCVGREDEVCEMFESVIEMVGGWKTDVFGSLFG